jgi:endoglucanase
MKTLAFAFVPLLCLLSSCLTSNKKEDAPPIKKIYLHNPWQGTSLSAPAIHGDKINSWDKSPMEQIDACGWYMYSTTLQNVGQFRFLLGGGWDGEFMFGRGGIGSATNFTAGTLLETQDEIFIWMGEDGKGSLAATQPVIAGCEGGTVIEKPAAGMASFAFPQERGYSRGILPEYYSWTDVQTLYELWKNAHFESNGAMARVKFEEPEYTVSEGIGYGMLISVYMDNAQNNTKADFDGLWAYYQAHADDYGLMHWMTKGFGAIAQSNAASDADLDVALALLLAYKQWGNAEYLTAALSLIEKIRLYEFSQNGLLRPGDAWETPRNASYFSFVAFELFSQVDTEHSAFWVQARDQHYQYIIASQNSSTGLIANWTNDAGAPANPGTGYVLWDHFGFDAIRVPWRAAWAWLWFGHTEANTIASAISTWIAGKTGGDALQIRSVYSLAGTAHSTHAGYTAGPAFIGAFATATMTTSNQDFLNATYSQMRGQISGEDALYYQSSLQVLYALLLTGNMVNFFE